MADELSTTISNLLFQFQGVAQRWYATRAVFLSELEGRRRGDGEKVYADRGRATPSNGRGPGRITANGKNVAIPAITSIRQGTGWLAEAGTVNTPHTLNTNQALVTMARAVHPISISLDAIFSAKGNFANTGDLAGASGILELEMQEAERAFAITTNEALHLNGDGLLAAVTSATGPLTTVVVGTSANSSYFYPGRIVDVLTRSNGTPVSNGTGASIVSYDESTGTITLNVSVTVTTNEGVYIEGSYGQAMNGLGAALAQTGVFENIDRSTNPGWKAVDGRGGDTTTAPLDISMLDGAYRRIGNNGDPPDFWLGDLAVVDRFGQGLVSQAQWAGNAGTLETGWTGYKYRDGLLVGDRHAKYGRLVGVDMNAYRLYSYIDGPGWIDGFDIGGRPTPMRFSRKLPAEVWFGDFVQFGVHKLNSTTYLDNLARAA